MEVAKRYTDQLGRIKDNVKRSYEYFKHNYDRYNEYKRFVFETSLTGDEVTLLMTINRPQLEFNVLEAYVSRLLGEFSKQEPDIEVSADDQNSADPLTIKVLTQHLRHTLTDSKNEHTRYEIYKDLLAGGFSVLKVYTEYANPMSFDQVINIERVFDPTLCGFDHLARYSHKGDGRYCFELFPREREEFQEEHPDIDVSKLNFRRDFAGFNWSYLNDKSPIILEAIYYEKKKKDERIVKLSDGRVMSQKKYNQLLAEWGDFAAPPAIVGKPRTTTIETIDRYHLIENMVLEHVETDYRFLPLIFADGNSTLVKTPKNGNVRQVTRPYVYHAKDSQRLKNWAGISLANEIENTIQHKFMVAKEALPKEEDYLTAYKDVQKANVLVYNALFEENPDQPIPNPIREIQRNPAPPEIAQAFVGADSLIQNILGSYDASLGINNNQLSGLAIVEAATQSNAAAMPYIVGFMQAYQRAAELYVDLLPKYYTTPRTLPIVDDEGKRAYVKINQEDGFNMFYDANALNVIVKAGASFTVQKSRTIMMVKEMMGMSPLFAQFIAEKGLNFVLDNMEGKGIEELKALVSGWVQEYEQQKQQAMQQQQSEAMNNPIAAKNQLAAQKMQMDAAKSQQQFMVDMAKLKADQNKILSDIERDKEKNAVQLVKAQTERFAKQVDLSLKSRDMHHKHTQVKQGNNYAR